MPKSEFIRLLKDTEILIKPKPQKAEDKNQKGGDKGGDKKDGEEQKQNVPTRKFEEDEANEAISKIYCFDNDQMDYVDFLEAIVRIALIYPFTEEELTELITFEHKMKYFLDKLDAKFKDQHKAFLRKMTNPNTEEMKFQPRVVVDEEEDDEYIDN